MVHPHPKILAPTTRHLSHLRLEVVGVGVSPCILKLTQEAERREGRGMARKARIEYAGAEEFRDQLLKRLDKAVEGNQRASYSGESIRQHDEYRAEELIGKGMKCLGIKESDLNGLAKGHDVKCLLAWLAHTRTMASHQWLSDRLQMGNSITVSTYIKRVKEAGSGPLCIAKKDLIRTIV
jgi:hypothetical protein